MTEPSRPMPHPTVTASQIEWWCWCGYRATLDKRDEHLATHKRQGEKPI